MSCLGGFTRPLSG